MIRCRRGPGLLPLRHQILRQIGQGRVREIMQDLPDAAIVILAEEDQGRVAAGGQ